MESPLVTTSIARVDPEEEKDDDDLDQVIMGVDVRDAGTVGCSYYSAQNETLYILGDMRSGNAELVDLCSSLTTLAPTGRRGSLLYNTVIAQIKPTVILTTTRVDHLCARSRQAREEDGICLTPFPYLLNIG